MRNIESEIYTLMLRMGVHTNIILPFGDLRPATSQLRDDYGHSLYKKVNVGFGMQF